MYLQHALATSDTAVSVGTMARGEVCVRVCVCACLRVREKDRGLGQSVHTTAVTQDRLVSACS